MKNIKFLFGGLALLTFACNKHEAVPPPHSDSGAPSIFIQKNVNNTTQYFTEDAGTVIYVIGEKGTSLYLPPNGLEDANENLVTENVDIELIKIDKKSEMVLMNKAAMGSIQVALTLLLFPTVSFYISISQYGNELMLTTPMKIYASRRIRFIDA